MLAKVDEWGQMDASYIVLVYLPLIFLNNHIKNREYYFSGLQQTYYSIKNTTIEPNKKMYNSIITCKKKCNCNNSV